MMKLVTLALVASFAATAALADEPAPNWNLDGDLYLGTAVPISSPESGAGVAMGGRANIRYESTGRHVLIFGELQGEGFNNGGKSTDIQFSQFYLNTGLMLGAKAVKWKTPLNVAVSRDIMTNEQIAVRFAFSGLYIKMLDETAGEGQLHQTLEAIADFVAEYISYRNEHVVNYNGNYVNDRSILGLYAAIKYEIEKRGWGATMQVDLLQDLSPSYTKINGRLIGFKQLSGDLKNLRPYVEVAGTLDHDTMDPTGSLQGALRVFAGISGRFGL
ncbi:MAG: hypothetical protein HY075_13885 [Deltaproteobacteria bacterium]|nr:hypothetical protein [Deltaproteobacteria bacterium]